MVGYLSGPASFRSCRSYLKPFPRKNCPNYAKRRKFPFPPIAKPEDLFEDPQLNFGGGLLDTALPGAIKTMLPRILIRIDPYDFGWRSHPPALGPDDQEILKTIGLLPDETQELRRDKSIVVRAKESRACKKEN